MKKAIESAAPENSALVEPLFRQLNAIFHDPFRPGQPTVYKHGQHFDVATICDGYGRQADLARSVAFVGQSGGFDRLILCSGDIQTGMLPIAAMQLLRLADPNKLGTDFLDRIIYDPTSVHTGTDLSLSWKHGAPFIAPDEEGKRPILIFCRSWHAPRVYLSALHQTPGFKPILAPCAYGGANPDNWRNNAEYKSWMWSELVRLSDYSAKGGIMAPVPGFDAAALGEVRDGLAIHLKENGIDPTKIARGAPSNDPAALQREPDLRQLVYPRRVAKNPRLMAKLTTLTLGFAAAGREISGTACAVPQVPQVGVGNKFSGPASTL